MRNATLIAGLTAVCWSPLVGPFIWLRPDMAAGALLLLVGIFVAVSIGAYALLYRSQQEQIEAARFADAARRLCADSVEIHGDVPAFPVALVRAPAHVREDLAA
jgi:ABC-type nitrate/sulfonate/bicarbonate transport system permease component